MTRLLDQHDELQAYYRDDRVVDVYIERRTAQPFNGHLHASQVRFLNQVLRDRRPRRLLEIAPGPARLTAELETDCPVVALDASAQMLAVARRRLRARARRCALLQGDAFQLPFADGTFDFIFSLKLIRHFQLDDRRRLYAEIRRVLAPGGGFVLDAQNRGVSLPHRQAKGVESYRIHDVLYEGTELVDELAGSGFRVVRMDGMLRHFAVQRALNRLRRVGLASPARLAIALIDRIPGGTPSTWMVLNEAAA